MQAIGSIQPNLSWHYPPLLENTQIVNSSLRLFSIPFLKNKPYADAVDPVVIVQKALAVSVEVLHIAADPFQ
jgi:hypothetical protein